MSYQEYNQKIINVADDSDSEEMSIGTESDEESKSSKSEESDEFINFNDRDDEQPEQHMNKAKVILDNIIKQTKNLRLRKKG